MKASQNLIGILALCASVAGFVTNDVFAKLASEMLPTGQIIALRGTIASAIIIPFALIRNRHGFSGLFHWSLVTRSLMEGAGAFSFLTALFIMPFANANAIIQTMPLVITVLAVLILKERVRWRRWAAIGVGFLGMLMIVRPGLEGFNTASWFVILAVLFMSARDILSRFIPTEITSTMATISASLIVTLMGFCMMPFETWQTPDLATMTYLVFAALFVLAGYFGMVVAARIADMSALAPFRYTAMLWAIVYGVVIWGEIPDAMTFAGTALIILGGLYVFHRERIKAAD